MKSTIKYLIALITIIYTYGKASTERRLSTLHGVTLDRATLALIGGGPLEEGGGGMALGYKVLFLMFFYILMSDYIVRKLKIIVKHIRKRSKKVVGKHKSV